MRQVVKRDLPIAFVPQQLTSYGGLELLRRYVRRIELPRRLHAACAALGGDYGGARLALLLLALPYVGARRLEHLQYLVGDPLVRRFTGLARVPTARTVSNWLRRFTQETLRPLVRLNQELVLDTLARLNVPRLTLDVDGTVVRTGATVAWAFRGFNPHHRKDRSYYPLLAHVAQTGHILRVKNRPGNVHDSKQASAFLRSSSTAVRGRLGRRVPLEFRMDAAFFQADVLRLLAARGCGYAIKVGYWSWLPLKQLAAERRHWHRAGPGRHRLRAPARHPAVEPPAARDDLPQARPAGWSKNLRGRRAAETPPGALAAQRRDRRGRPIRESAAGSPAWRNACSGSGGILPDERGVHDTQPREASPGAGHASAFAHGVFRAGRGVGGHGVRTSVPRTSENLA